jgi:hypothetical protein
MRKYAWRTTKFFAARPSPRRLDERAFGARHLDAADGVADGLGVAEDEAFFPHPGIAPAPEAGTANLHEPGKTSVQ